MTSKIESKRWPIAPEEWERQARQIIERGPFDYISGGSGSEQALAANTADFLRWSLVPRMLRDISQRDINIELFGHTLAAPILLAPIGMQAIAHPDGELASAKAAALEGIPFIVSTVSSYSLEDIAEALGDQPRWFQLYWSSDLDVTKSMVQRAEEAGYSAIVLTVDTPLLGYREKDLANAYSPLKLGRGMANYVSDPVFRQKLAAPPEQDQQGAIKYLLDIVYRPELSWQHISILRNMTNLPILIKGVLHPEDAQLAIEYGFDGIIVSNHGARQLDGTISSIAALPKISEVVQDRVPVLMDSGIRRGVDVLKALALGARAVLLGRPYIYGLAVGGEEGARQVIKNIKDDLNVNLALTGHTKVTDLHSECLLKV